MLYLEAKKEWARVLKDCEGHRSWAEGLQKPDTAESTERTEPQQEKFRAGNKAQDEIKHKTGTWHLDVVCLPYGLKYIHDIFLKS